MFISATDVLENGGKVKMLACLFVTLAFPPRNQNEQIKISNTNGRSASLEQSSWEKKNVSK